MQKLEGITSDESVFHSIRCKYDNLWGDLVITNKGIVFLEIKGMLGQGRERLQQFDFADIDLAKTKKKNSGIFKYCIEINSHSNYSEKQTIRFSCEKYKAVLFLALFEKQKLSLKTPEESSAAIESLSKFKRYGDLLNVAKNPKMKPYVTTFFLEKSEATILSQLRNRPQTDLYEVAMNKEVHSLIARLHESDSKKLSKDQVYYTVTDIVSHLISHRDLDGIITEVGSYVSNRNLARRKVPYDMLADFETILAQLYENGILIYKIECPTCFRKMKYPKRGKKTTCQFCKSPIIAMDVFKKVKDLL
ncbi:MAG: hypothetical protein ACTSV2_04250 [Candidatus Thorarchaeota archaeon]